MDLRESLPLELQAALGCLSADQLTRRSQAVCAAVGELAGLPRPLGLPALLPRALDPLPAPQAPQALVDLLKHPLCVGAERRAVLGQLGRHYDRSFATHWDFVEFARSQGLDFKSPARRPGAPAAER
jgi:hypothetical protein